MSTRLLVDVPRRREGIRKVIGQCQADALRFIFLKLDHRWSDLTFERVSTRFISSAQSRRQPKVLDETFCTWVLFRGGEGGRGLHLRLLESCRAPKRIAVPLPS